MNAGREERVHNFIRHMVTGISNASLYSPHHPQVGRLCARGLAQLLEAMDSEPTISFLVIDGELIHDGSSLGNDMYLIRFAEVLAAHGIGSVQIARSVELREIEAFVISLSKKRNGHEAVRSSDNIRLGKVEVRHAQPGDTNLKVNNIGQGRAVIGINSAEMAKIMEIYEEVRRHKKLRVVGIQEIVAGIIETLKQDATPFLALAPLRSMDEYTFTHSLNVCTLNLAQAMGLQVEHQLLRDIGIAALLHDIGKLFIPLEIINKQDRLDDVEWELMKQHPLKGAEYLLASPGLGRLAVVTAFEHHMKFNNNGYPEAPQGWRQNLCSQMTTISDIFDAMRTERSYRSSMETKQVISVMWGLMGLELHPALTKNFFKILARFSLGQKPGDSEGEDGSLPAKS
jgi:HD-GYP domain-containing protein (c-di-GMP phosphodiesterase class II)